VHFSTSNGNAVAPGDYVAQPDTVLTFAPGETSKPVNVTVKGDTSTADDATETFSVNLSGASGAVIGDATGSVTIRDDDQ
jgi:hypothetical protein